MRQKSKGPKIKKAQKSKKGQKLSVWYLEVGVPSARALGRSTAAVGLVQQVAEDVEEEHDGDDVQVGEQTLKRVRKCISEGQCDQIKIAKCL